MGKQKPYSYVTEDIRQIPVVYLLNLETKMLNERAIRNLKKLKNDDYVLYVNRKVMDEDVELAIKSLRNQSVLDELLGQGLKIISSNGDITEFDKYFEK